MKRYDFDADGWMPGHIFGMDEQENGEWVTAESAFEQIESLEMRIKELEQQIQAFHDNAAGADL